MGGSEQAERDGVRQSRGRWLVALLLVLAAGIGMRAGVNFSASVPPGVDAAYYPVQARSLLEQGKLAYHDLPLIFAIDAGLARTMMAAGGLGVDDATLLASRIVDSVVQPFAGVAIFALGLAWAGERRQRTGVLLSVTAAAVVATVSYPMLRMTGDFEKNSLGLVWLATAAWSAQMALRRGRAWRWVLLAVVVALASVTHVAVLGATGIMLGVTLAVHLLTRYRSNRRTLVVGAMVGAATCGLAWLAVYVLSPNRAAALLAAPMKLFSRGEGPGGPGGPGGAGGPPGPGGPGGPPVDLMSAGLVVAVYVTAGMGLWSVWRARHDTEPARRSVVSGCAFTALLLCCPLLNPEYFTRLSLMAPVPAAIVLMSLLLDRDARGRAWWPAPLIGLLAVASVIAGLGLIDAIVPGPDGNRRRPGGMQGPGGGLAQGIMTRVVRDEDAGELRSLRSAIADPAHTVVLARHGLQWWAAFFMNVPVREDRVAEASIEKYDRVLFLEEKNGRGSSGPGEGPGPQTSGSPRPDRGQVPVGAKVIQEGRSFRLYEVRSRSSRPGSVG